MFTKNWKRMEKHAGYGPHDGDGLLAVAASATPRARDDGQDRLQPSDGRLPGGVRDRRRLRLQRGSGGRPDRPDQPLRPFPHPGVDPVSRSPIAAVVAIVMSAACAADTADTPERSGPLTVYTVNY